MTRQQLSDALTGQVDPKALRSMSAKDMATRYDKLAPTSEPTTVVRGSEEPPASGSSTASGVEQGAAPPPSPSGVGSLPVAAEAAPAIPEQAAAAVQVSKRARAKAAMQEPTEPIRPEVEPHADSAPVPLEEITPVADRQVEQARQDRLGDLADAVRAVPAKGLDGVLRKAQRYLSEAIGKTDGSRDAVAELIHNWIGEQPTAAYPGTRITPRMLGEHFMERVAGQHVAEPEGRSAEIRAAGREDIAREGGESKTVTGESIEQAAETRSEGAEGTSALTPVVTEKTIPDHTDRRRVADALIQRVLNHEMTLPEAETRYGKPQEGAGRSRRWATVADRIQDWIKHAEDPATEQKILLDLAKTQNDKDLTPHQRSTQTKKLTAELARTGPEFAAELRGHLDPVGREADLQRMRDEIDARTAALKGQGPRLLQHAPDASGINPRSSRMVRIARDPRIGANLVRAMQASNEHGVPFTARDAMRTVMQDPLVGAEQPGLKAVATQLFKAVHDIPVYTPQEAYDRGHIGSRMLEEYHNNPQTYGHYDPNVNNEHIVLNIDAEHQHGNHAETAVHEVMHSVFSHHIHNLLTNDPNHRDIRALSAIREELGQHLREAELSGRIEPGSAEHDSITYALSHPQELHTMLMTNADVQAFASSVRATDPFRQQMRQLGFAPREAGRSVWSHFVDVVRKALGFDTPKSASDYTLFDHLARPITDIAEHGVRYHASLMPKDPTLRAQAEPLYWAATSSLTDRARDALSNVDVRGLGDRARRVILQGATSDGIVARYTRMLPGLERWRASYEAIQRSSKQFADKYADTVKNLTARYNRLDDPNALGRLMTDATLAKAHLGPDATNAHLTSDTEKAALSALQARYARLPAPARDLYNEFKDTYAAWYKQKRAAQLGALVRGFMPDATGEQHEALTKALSRKSTLDNFLKDMDNSPIAKAFGDQWQENRKLARGIAQVHAQGFVQGDYFPLRRFGNYVVRYGDKMTPGDYGVEMFESRRKAEERRAELAAAGMEPYQVSDKRESDLRDIVPYHPAVDELTASLASRGYPEAAAKEIRDQLNGILLEHATHSAASRAAQGMRRKGVLGASTDQARILSDEFVNTQAGIGHLEHGLERVQAISHMRTVELPALESQNYKGRAGDAITAAAVLREVEQRSTAIDPDSVLQSIGAKANTFSFAQSLMSPSHMLTSSMEAHTNGMALLGARHGVFKAGAALTRALAQASPMLKTGAMRTIQAVKGELKSADWNLPELLKQRMIDKGSNKAGMAQLFKSLEDANLIDHTMLKDIQQQANPNSKFSKVPYNAWARFRDF